MTAADCSTCGFEKDIVGMGGCNCPDTLLSLVNQAGAKVQIENGGGDPNDLTNSPLDDTRRD